MSFKGTLHFNINLGCSIVRMLQAESIRDKYTGGTEKTLVVKKDSIDE